MYIILLHKIPKNVTFQLPLKFPHRIMKNKLKHTEYLYNILIPTLGFSGVKENLQARWSDITKSYEEDQSYLVFRTLRNIKEFYLNPVGQLAMKVSVAAQTLSFTLSTYMFNLVKNAILPPRALATATFLMEMDTLFDSLNSSTKEGPSGKPYKCTVTDKSGHVAFWEEAFQRVNSWRFLRKPKDETHPQHWKPPSQKGWLHALKVFPLIWEHLKAAGFPFLRTRSLNQDALENLFGNIRAGCGCNENPTVTQFVSSLKTQVINGLTNQGLKGTNCEKDERNLLSNLRSFVNCSDTSKDDSINVMEEYPNQPLLAPSETNGVNINDIARDVAAGATSTLSVAYVSGFILKRMYKKFNCDACKIGLFSDDLEPCNQFIKAKEFSDSENKLFYPSEKLVVAVGHGLTLLESRLPTLRKSNKISEKCSAFLRDEIDFSFLSCETHFDFIKNTIIKSICLIGIPWYCTRIIRDIRAESRKKTSKQKTRKMLHS